MKQFISTVILARCHGFVSITHQENLLNPNTVEPRISYITPVKINAIKLGNDSTSAVFS